MTRYFTKKVTIEKLAAHVRKAIQKHPDFGIWSDKENEFDAALAYGNRTLPHLTATVENDLSSVSFDLENVATEGLREEGLCGFKRNEQGLSYLGVLGAEIARFLCVSPSILSVRT